MTDNCSELRDALNTVWPNFNTLLCRFHIMQQVWKWLCEKKNNISANDRTSIILIFKQLVYEVSEDEFQVQYDECQDNDIVKIYPKLVDYLNHMYEIKEHRSEAFRGKLTLRNNHTNNIAESQFMAVKDRILQRVKEYIVVALFEY